MSVEHYAGIKRCNSVILNFDNPEARGQKSSYAGFCDESGLRMLLESYTTDKLDDQGYPAGLLVQAENKLKAAQYSWKKYNEAQSFPKKQPEGLFLENIEKAKAHILIIKEEITVLEQKVSVFDEKIAREDNAVRSTITEQRNMIGKLVDGKLVQMDGRAVKDGKFVDNGEEVKKYIERVKKEKRKEAQKQFEEEKKRAEENKNFMMY